MTENDPQSPHNMSLSPIGFVRSGRKYRYETPRQGVLAGSEEGRIELLPGMNYEQALIKLDTFDRIWVLYRFHLNDNWKPMVQPPRHTKEKVGVFASRAPHRPNPIGLSCVRLIRIEGLTLYMTEFDMLDGTPVLDIKPYLPYTDSFPGASSGWAHSGHAAEYAVSTTPGAARQMEWLLERADINLRRYADVQLQTDPRNTGRKRITSHGENTYTLAYRIWRIRYAIDDEAKRVEICGIDSGYSAAEIADTENDKYADKHIHAEFAERFRGDLLK